jgi:class 3 adenylate cyclase/pimeloyl-ACP methyl ester carboxylesterase
VGILAYAVAVAPRWILAVICQMTQACAVNVPDVHYARNGDIALAYQVVGDGPFDLVYAPQWISNLEIIWENPLYVRFLEALARFSRLVILDPRGTGLSDRLSQADLPPPEILMEDLGVVMDAADCERAVLFGSSDSGSLCALFAATHPERTTALVIYGTAARGTVTDDYPWAWTVEQWDSYLAALAVGWGSVDYAKETTAWLTPSLIGDAEQVRWWTRMQRLAASPNAIAAIERIWSETDIRPILPAIQAPTLVLHRTGDPVEHIETGRDLARRIPGAKFVELPGADWPPWAGDQKTLLEQVESFVREIRQEEAQLDRVLATVMFTDIVRSTEKAAELGDRAWRHLVERHHATVRALLARYRGREIDIAGDGFFASFDGPARAVRCAQAIVQAVRPLGLEIRAGLHTGEVEMIADRIGGIAVNIGARVGGIAAPSEVLVSQTVKDLVAGSGLEFEDRGEHVLKGVPGAWRLFAARLQ